MWVASLFYGQVRCFSSMPESSDVPQQDWSSFASSPTALTFISLLSYQAKPTEEEVKKLGKVLGLQEGVRPLPRLLKRAAASLTLCLFSPRPSSIPRISLPLRCLSLATRRRSAPAQALPHPLVPRARRPDADAAAGSHAVPPVRDHPRARLRHQVSDPREVW